MINTTQGIKNPEEILGLNLKDSLDKDGWVTLPDDQLLVSDEQKIDPEHLPEGIKTEYFYTQDGGTTVVVYNPQKVKIHTERGDSFESVQRMNDLNQSGATQIPYTSLFVEKLEQKE
jgi:hypothetical protein